MNDLMLAQQVLCRLGHFPSFPNIFEGVLTSMENYNQQVLHLTIFFYLLPSFLPFFLPLFLSFSPFLSPFFFF